jgi:hypothetical protein
VERRRGGEEELRRGGVEISTPQLNSSTPKLLNS